MPQPLTPKKEKVLRAFQRQVDRLRRSSIVQGGSVTFTYSTRINFPSGQIETEFTGYDPTAFQSQLPLLRQFFLNDAISFNHIHNIVNECCDRADLKGWARYAYRVWTVTLSRLPNEDHRFFHGVHQNVGAAIKSLFYGYGGLFHVNVDDPDEEDKVREIQEASLQNAFPYFWQCLRLLDIVVHIWLDDPSAEIKPPPTE